MPIRTASLNKKIAANGVALHRAMARRTGKEPTEAEAALAEERRLLKEERAKQRAQGPKRRPSALERLVRTHHPEAKNKGGKKESHAAGEVKKPKTSKSRAEKHAQQAEALEAARRSPKKPPAKPAK